MGKGPGHSLKDDRGKVSTHKKWTTSCDGSRQHGSENANHSNIPTGMTKIKTSDNAKYDKHKGSWNSHTLLVGL